MSLLLSVRDTDKRLESVVRLHKELHMYHVKFIQTIERSYGAQFIIEIQPREDNGGNGSTRALNRSLIHRGEQRIKDKSSRVTK